MIGLPITMTATTASTSSGRSMRTAGSNSMPIDTKKSTEKASCSGSEFAAARWLSCDSPMMTPAKNAPSAKDTPKAAADPNAMPSASARTERVNSSREPVRATPIRIRGTTRGPSSAAISTKPPTLASVSRSTIATGPCDGAACSASACPPIDLRESRQQHERKDHGEVLDDQPAHGDAAHGRLDQVSFLERLQQHHGARHGNAEPEDDAVAEIPSPDVGKPHAEQRGEDDLADRPGNGDAAHRQQVRSREMQADAEHQQDHADLGQLPGHAGVGRRSPA